MDAVVGDQDELVRTFVNQVQIFVVEIFFFCPIRFDLASIPVVRSELAMKARKD